jgi:cysteine desulfurase family protein (TIGR01976 family)
MTATLESFFAAQRQHFPALGESAGHGDLVHLNNAAGSEMPEAAIAAMAGWIRSNFCNEGATFRRLEASRALVLAARQATADLLGAAPEEIGFGANTTTNLFSVIRTLGRTLRPGDRVLVSEACHEANIAPWRTLEETGAVIAEIPMLDDTHLDYEWLEAHVDERTRIVTVGASSNGTGTIHDIARVARAARRVSALVSIDAAHFVPHRPLDVSRLDADLVFFSIYKCFGPHLGAFYARRSLCEGLPPSGLPRPPAEEATAARFETGTRSFESLAGWLATLGYLEDLGRSCPRPSDASKEAAAAEAPPTRREALRAGLEAVSAWEEELTRYADARLRALPGLELYAQRPDDPRPRLGVFCFNLRGIPPSAVARALEDAGIEGVLGHNGAIRTLARLAGGQGGIGIRLSLAHYNSREDVDRALDCLARLSASPGPSA